MLHSCRVGVRTVGKTWQLKDMRVFMCLNLNIRHNEWGFPSTLFDLNCNYSVFSQLTERSDTFKLCFTGWENAVKGLIIRQIFSRKFSFKQDLEKWNYSQVTSDLFNFHLSIFCFLSRLGLQGQHSKHRVPDLPFPRQLLSWERKV